MRCRHHYFETSQSDHTFVRPGHIECSLNIMINTPSLFANKGAFSSGSLVTADAARLKSSAGSLLFLIYSRAVMKPQCDFLPLIFPPSSSLPSPLSASSGLNKISSREEMSAYWPVGHFSTSPQHHVVSWRSTPTGWDSRSWRHLPASQDGQFLQRSCLLTLQSWPMEWSLLPVHENLGK